jgi:hypothetical protein
LNAPANIARDVTADPDPGLVFLQHAAARLMLVEAGEMEIEEALVGLIEPFEELVGPLLCDCSHEIIERWERNYPPIQRKRFPP